MVRPASQNRGDPWNLAGWVTPRLPRSRWEDLPRLTLTIARREVAPGNTPSRQIWEVKQALVACE